MRVWGLRIRVANLGVWFKKCAVVWEALREKGRGPGQSSISRVRERGVVPGENTERCEKETAIAV